MSGGPCAQFAGLKAEAESNTWFCWFRFGFWYFQYKSADFVGVFADFKNQPSQITVVSHGWGPEMQARRAFLVTTLVIYESNISEDVVVFGFVFFRAGSSSRGTITKIASVKTKTITIQADF